RSSAFVLGRTDISPVAAVMARHPAADKTFGKSLDELTPVRFARLSARSSHWRTRFERTKRNPFAAKSCCGWMAMGNTQRRQSKTLERLFMKDTTHIVIVGGGFAGTATALNLEKTFRRDPSVEITLIDSENFFTFTPLLAEVPSGSIQPNHIVVPLRA